MRCCTSTPTIPVDNLLSRKDEVRRWKAFSRSSMHNADGVARHARINHPGDRLGILDGINRGKS